MLTAEMSTRAVACALNVYFSTINRLQGSSREFGSTFNQAHTKENKLFNIPLSTTAETVSCLQPKTESALLIGLISLLASLAEMLPRQQTTKVKGAPTEDPSLLLAADIEGSQFPQEVCVSMTLEKNN